MIGCTTPLLPYWAEGVLLFCGLNMHKYGKEDGIRESVDSLCRDDADMYM